MQRSLLLFEEGIKSPYTKKVYRGHLEAFLKFAKDFRDQLAKK